MALRKAFSIHPLNSCLLRFLLHVDRLPITESLVLSGDVPKDLAGQWISATFAWSTYLLDQYSFHLISLFCGFFLGVGSKFWGAITQIIFLWVRPLMQPRLLGSLKHLWELTNDKRLQPQSFIHFPQEVFNSLDYTETH